MLSSSERPADVNARRLSAETDARLRRFTPALLDRELARADVAVDALFGTGFRGVPEGEVAEAIEAVNASLVPVVSVDIPSGVDGATGAAPGAVIRADLTVTFGAAKTGAVLLPGAEHAGDVRVVDIGFPDDLLPDTCGLTEPDDVVGVLPERATDAHKKASGTLVVVAGSRRMTGAVRLLAHAAGRIGAGYVVVAVPAVDPPGRAARADGDGVPAAPGDRGRDRRAGGARRGPRGARRRGRARDGAGSVDERRDAGVRAGRASREPGAGRARRRRAERVRRRRGSAGRPEGRGRADASPGRAGPADRWARAATG